MIWLLILVGVMMLVGLWLIAYEQWIRPEMDDRPGGPLPYDADPWMHDFVPDDEGSHCMQQMEDEWTFCDLTREEHEQVYGQHHGPSFLPESEPHKYQPNREQPGHCAAWLPTRGGGEQQCLMSKGMHDE